MFFGAAPDDSKQTRHPYCQTFHARNPTSETSQIELCNPEGLKESLNYNHSVVQTLSACFVVRAWHMTIL